MFEQLFHYYQQHPWIIFLLIILSSYILEDAAIVSAALFSSEGLISIPLSISAIFIGIASGDLALYLMGRYAERFTKVKHRLESSEYINALQSFLQKRPFLNIFFIRFLPGIRTVAYSFCGFWKIPLGKFLSAILLATSVWTALVFYAIYQLGTQSWLANSHAKWYLIPVIILVMILMNKIVPKLFQARNNKQ